MAQAIQHRTGPTVSELGEDFELSLAAENKSPQTIRIYTTAVRQLADFLNEASRSVRTVPSSSRRCNG